MYIQCRYTPQPHGNTLVYCRYAPMMLFSLQVQQQMPGITPPVLLFSLRLVVPTSSSRLSPTRKFPFGISWSLEVVNCHPMIHQWSPPAMHYLLLRSRLGTWGLVPSPRRVSTTSLSSSCFGFKLLSCRVSFLSEMCHSCK